MENEKFDRALQEKNGSVLGLVDMLMELDKAMPYLEISPDDEIAKYTEKYLGLGLSGVDELNEFHSYLEDKLGELGDSDERAKKYFEMREHRELLESLPRQLSKLEKTASEFYELKKPIRAIMNYVWDAVMKYDIRINNELINIYKKSKLIVRVSLGTKAKFPEILIRKKCKLKVNYWSVVNKEWKKYHNSAKVIDFIKEDFKRIDYIETFATQIKAIFNLPKIIEDYAKNKEKSIEEKIKKLDKTFKEGF